MNDQVHVAVAIDVGKGRHWARFASHLHRGAGQRDRSSINGARVEGSGTKDGDGYRTIGAEIDTVRRRARLDVDSHADGIDEGYGVLSCEVEGSRAVRALYFWEDLGVRASGPDTIHRVGP